MTTTTTVSSTTTSLARNPLRWFVFAVVLIANVMDLMDATIVNVAGPSVRSALGGSNPRCSGSAPATRSPSRSS